MDVEQTILSAAGLGLRSGNDKQVPALQALVAEVASWFAREASDGWNNAEPGGKLKSDGGDGFLDILISRSSTTAGGRNRLGVDRRYNSRSRMGIPMKPALVIVISLATATLAQTQIVAQAFTENPADGSNG